MHSRNISWRYACTEEQLSWRSYKLNLLGEAGASLVHKYTLYHGELPLNLNSLSCVCKKLIGRIGNVGYCRFQLEIGLK